MSLVVVLAVAEAALADAKCGAGSDPKDILCLTAKQKTQNEAMFEKWSVFAGTALLNEPDGKGDKSFLPVVGAQLLMGSSGNADSEERNCKKHHKKIGWGPFVALNASDAPGANDADKDIDYIGAGVVVSGRLRDTSHMFSLGVGYMIDRVGLL